MIFNHPELSRCDANAEPCPWHVNTGREIGTERSISVRRGSTWSCTPLMTKGFYWIQFKYLKVRMEVSISIPNFCLLELPSVSLQILAWAKGCKKKSFSETKETKDKTVIELWTTPNPAQTNLLFWIFKEKNLSTWQTRVVPKKQLQPVISGQPEKSFHMPMIL